MQRTAGLRSHAQAPVAVPIIAVIAASAAGLRYEVAGGLTVTVAVAIPLVPLWWTSLHRYRFARGLIILGLLGVLSGVLLSMFDSIRPLSQSLLRQEVFTFATLIAAVGLLLWARTQIGAGWTAVAFGVGGLMLVALTGGNPENIWKFSLAIPVSAIVLGLADQMGSRLAELLALGALASLSLVSDSRSMTAFLLLAAALTLGQAFAGKGRGKPSPGRVLLLLAVFGVAMFSLFQALILDGVLGDAAQQRTQSQIDASGSLLTGGRPELGAATALIAQQPWGYGAGTVPVSQDVWLAKDGMNQLSYEADNGYVENYMFGGHFEVHSSLGDLWIRFGPLGAAFALMLLGVAVWSTARLISTRSASALVSLLVLLGIWDTFFSPLLTSISNLALLFALTAVPRAAASISAD